MLKYFLLLLFVLISILAPSQQEELKNKIIWQEDRPLNWEDFKGPIDERSKFYAQTNSGIYYHVQQTSQTHFLVFIETFFDPLHSWKKYDQVTDNLLKHEQLHFDIHELHSRLFVKSIRETKFQDCDKVSGKIRDLYAETMADAQELSLLYDKETNHSMDKMQQLEWNKKMKKMLEATSDYDLKEILIELR